MSSGSITSKDEPQQLLSTLPKGHGWGIDTNLYQYQGFWCQPDRLKGVMEFQREFKPLNTDLILATLPKSGTIWLKSIAFAIINRARYPPSSKQHPLLTTSSHSLVPFIEYFQVYGTYDSISDYITSNFGDDSLLPTRLFATHIPYPSLPESIKNNINNCKIVYLCRNPKDNFISLWSYLNKRGNNVTNPLPLEKALDLFCNGVSYFGPFWDHILGYWKASQENPKKVLFLKYEDLKKEPMLQVKSLAEFLGFPFSMEEENECMIEEMLSLCSFEFMKNLDVNKNGVSELSFESKIFFRKGEVGDWKNYLTPSMAERIDRLFEEKLLGSGLVFDN